MARKPIRFISARMRFKHLHGDNKELLIVADADHTDLYDNLQKIPFDQIVTFYNTWMPAR